MTLKHDNLIDKLFEYNLWANTQLVQLCSTLTAEQLETEATGVFGRIHPTLIHLVQAEGGYVRRLTGSSPFEEGIDWDNLAISDMLSLVQISGSRLIEIASQTDPAVKHRANLPDRTVHFFNWTVVLQALYHAIEHRTQIKVILTKLGIEHPDLAAWDYVEGLLPENEFDAG